MGIVDLGKVRGTQTYTGNKITGSNANATVFPETGIAKAYEGDLYINTDAMSEFKGNVYECTVAGKPDAAKWIFKGSIRGPKVDTVNNLKSTSTEDALSAYQGKRLLDLMKEAGVFSRKVVVDYDRTVFGVKLTIDNVTSTFTFLINGSEYRYTYEAAGEAETTILSVSIGTNLGMSSNGGVISEIRSSATNIYSYILMDNTSASVYSKTTDIWGEVNDNKQSHEITGTIVDGDETFCDGPIRKVVNGIKKVFFPITHAKAVWFEKRNGVTVYDKIVELVSGISNEISNRKKAVEELSESMASEITGLRNSTSSKISNEASERKAADDTLAARMDTFTQLPSGSTAGDAELQDIRVGAGGEVYGSAGAAVRGQIGELKGDLSKHFGLLDSSNLNDVDKNSIYILSSDNTYSNMPIGFTSGYLFTDSSEKEYTEYMNQMLFSNKGIARRTKAENVWNPWAIYNRTDINQNTELGSISGINLTNYPNGYSLIDMPINSVIVCDGSLLSAKAENNLSELSTGYNYHVEKIGRSPFSLIYVTGSSGSMHVGWVNDTVRTVSWFDLAKGYTHFKNVDYELELGNYGTTFPDYVSGNTRARVILPIQVCNKIKITPTSDIKFGVRLMNENLTMISLTGWIDEETVYTEKDCYYVLISVSYKDDRVLTEYDFGTLKEKLSIVRDGVPTKLKKLKIESVAYGQDLSWKSPNCVSMISVKYKRTANKQPIPIAWLYRDNTEPYNFYVSNGSNGLVRLFAWDKSVTFDGNQPPINYSIAITTEGDIVCVYRGEKAQYDGLTTLRQNPIVYPHGDYDHPVVVDFGSDDAPTSWLQNCGYYAEDGKLFICEYTRTQFTHSYAWEAVAPYTNKSNWTKIKTFDVSGNNNGFKHCHMIDKDPFTGILYLSTGDHDVGANIYYSTDNGATWNTLIAENEKYSRQLNFIWCKEKVYWATDTTTIGTHFLFESKRDSNGVIDVESIKELYKFYTSSATYNLCYSKDANGLLILERFDSATTTPMNVYFYDLERRKMTIIDRLKPNFASLYGFRVEAINTYQGITDRRFICGFSVYPNQIDVEGSSGNVYANTDNGMVPSDYGNVGNINNLCLSVVS